MTLRLALGVLLLAEYIGAHGQDTVWSNAWYTTDQPGFSLDDVSVVGTSTGQLVYVGDIYGWSYQITSMTPGGVVNWQINVPEFAVGLGSLAAGADGSVFFGATKIDASGHVVWYRNDLGARESILTADALYVSSCDNVASLDIGTGATRWAVDRGSAAHCGSSIGSDAAGNVYLLSQFSGPPYTRVPPIHFAKYDVTGAVKWELSIATTQISASFVGAADGRVFINQGPDLAAYDATTGALLWTHPQTTGQLMAGIPASPITIDVGGTHKLDAADGHIQWTQSIPGGLLNSIVQGSDIYVCGYEVSKIDSATGNTEWSNGVSYPGCFRPVLDGGNVLTSTIDYASGAIRINAVDAVTGNSVSQALAGPTQQGVQTWDSFVDQGRIVQLGQVGNVRSNEHLRSVDASTGTVDWDVPFVVPVSNGAPALGRSSDSVIVSASSGYSSYNVGAYFYIGSFARSDGSLRWSVLGPTFNQTYFFQSYVWTSAPLTDSHGDVFVSYSATGNCYYNSSTTCPTASLMKLAAADGAVLWHFDSLAAGDTAPPFTLIGDDVLIAGGFSGAQAGDTIARLSGSDGSVSWAQAPIGNDGVLAVSVNPDGTILLTNLTTRALLQASGSVVWTDHPTFTCSLNCALDNHLQLADGTILYVVATTNPVNGVVAGRLGAQPLVQNTPAQEDTVDADAPADVKVVPWQIRAGNGGVWITGYLRQPPYTHFYFLAKLDPATLAVTDQQVLATDNAEAFAPGLGFDILAAPEGNQLPAHTYVFGGGAPATSGAAVFDTTIDARGDLALSLGSADQPTASTFQATVTYAGDKPLAHVRLTLWHQGFYDAGALSCATANASNCAAESHSGYVETTFDIQPGGSVTVSGTYPASKELSTLYGAVRGPPSLGESTLGNNFRSAPLGDLLFRNGFE